MFDKTLLIEYSQYLLNTGMINEGWSHEKIVKNFLAKNEEKIKSGKKTAYQYIIQCLDTLPEAILHKSNDHLETIRLSEELLYRKKNIEDITMLDISGELDDSGKKKHSNDSKRKIELDRKLSINSEYQGLLSESLKSIKQIKEEENNISFLKRQNTNINTKALLLAKWD